MVEEGLYARAHKKIEELMPTLKGETLTREQWHRLLHINPNDTDHIAHKEAINLVLYNMSQVNIKKKIVKNDRGFKVVDDTLVPIDFKNASGEYFNMLWPFGIHKYCFLHKKNVAVVYGSKDSGKTALLLNIIRLNMGKHNISYFSSEMGASELALRLGKYDGLALADWNFNAYERSYHFNEVVDPNGLNLVDFLELGGDDTEYFKGVSLVRQMYDVLDGGVLIIACQKNRDAELPKGGTGLLEKARVALSLDPSKVTLAVAKNWADGVISSPKGKSWTYQLVGGINILNIIEES